MGIRAESVINDIGGEYKTEGGISYIVPLGGRGCPAPFSCLPGESRGGLPGPALSGKCGWEEALLAECISFQLLLQLQPQSVVYLNALLLLSSETSDFCHQMLTETW